MDTVKDVIEMLWKHWHDMEYASRMFGELPGQDMTRRLIYRLERIK